MKIGRFTLVSDAVLGPMAGVSDLGFRTLARRYGAGLTYTEMVSVCGLMHRNAKTEVLTAVAPCETPSAIQLFGSDPDVFSKAARHPAVAKFDIIDVNMGCPVPKVVSRGEGSALMKDAPRAMDIVRALVESSGGKSVTVKIRAGWDRPIAPDFALRMQEAGASAVTVHGRTRQQQYTGTADWGIIRETVSAVTIPVVANGDVKSAEDYRRVKAETGAAGVMIARGAVGRTPIFAEIRGETPEVDLQADFNLQFDILRSTYSDHVACMLIKPHLIAAVSGRAGAKELRLAVGTAKTVEDVAAVIAVL